MVFWKPARVGTLLMERLDEHYEYMAPAVPLMKKNL